MTKTPLDQITAEGRLQKALSRLYRYNDGVMTLEEKMQQAITLRTFEESSVRWNRRKYNNMNASEQETYQKKLDTKVTKYYAELADGSLVSIPKIVYQHYLELDQA